MKLKRDPGFSLVEVIVAIIIMLILSGAVGFAAVKYIDHAKFSTCKNQIESFRLSLQSYYLDCGM